MGDKYQPVAWLIECEDGKKYISKSNDLALAIFAGYEQPIALYDQSVIDDIREVLEQVANLAPGQPGCGDISRAQRTMADVFNLLNKLPMNESNHGDHYG